MKTNSTEYFGNLTSLRIFYALVVTWSHSYPLTNSAEPLALISKNAINGGSFAVWGFFFLSGYLVSLSYDRTPNLLIFSINRIARIWPGLIVALLVTLIIAWLSNRQIPLVDFYPNAKTYFLQNIKLFPGVAYNVSDTFPNAPHASVNGSLWTLPWELRMYVIVAILGCGGLLMKRELANAAIILFAITLLLPNELSPIAKYFDNATVPWMVGAFLIGMGAHANKAHLSVKMGSIVLLGASGLFFYLDHDKSGWLFFACAFTYFIGFSELIKLPDIKNDVSYGIYIYSFPIQQLMISSMKINTPLSVFFATLPLVIALGYGSWRLVEKPSLNLKKKCLKTQLARKLSYGDHA